jgi:hypothetical protein
MVVGGFCGRVIVPPEVTVTIVNDFFEGEELMIEAKCMNHEGHEGSG